MSACQPNQLDCNDLDPPAANNNNSTGGNSTWSGAHRFIGVASVASLLLLGVLLWIVLGAWPRRKLRALLCGVTPEEVKKIGTPSKDVKLKIPQELVR
ncbi:hypothetical protein FB45DRAFT_554692 [Roridomyces roridus]|uniref:Uncharacterized protein n=1 Tax=Roridomyces roridus TaxID=1738132 RepID=A0AAD7FLR1_9AGAR|nr:hypothetical protein FB45DRAFT_554692 [Roridomyces roridus]